MLISYSFPNATCSSPSSIDNRAPPHVIDPSMTVEKNGEYVTIAAADEVGRIWLSLTDEQRSELLRLRREQGDPNTLPAWQ